MARRIKSYGGQQENSTQERDYKVFRRYDYALPDSDVPHSGTACKSEPDDKDTSMRNYHKHIHDIGCKADKRIHLPSAVQEA